MNKTVLIAGGASVVSLAIGGTAGYFIAKSKFDKTINDLIAIEVDKTRKHFSDVTEKLEEELRELKDSEDDEQEVASEPDDEPSDLSSELDRKAAEKLKANAKTALTNYQGISTGQVLNGPEKPDLQSLVNKNIFEKGNQGQKPPQPRNEKGRFRPRHSQEDVSESENDPPQLISEEEFLANDPENEQESALYYIRDKVVVLTADLSEEIETAVIGEVNLTLFPEDDPRVIYVRNSGLNIDYQVTLTESSLTKDMGMGEDEHDADSEESELDDEYANQD